MALPENVVSKAGRSEYADVALAAQDDIATAVADVLALPFPDASAVPAEVDGLNVDEGDVAYVWDTYLYVERDNGYSIRQFGDGLLADEIIFVDQDEACRRFSLTHYAREGDGTGVPDGDAVLFFAYAEAGAGKSFDWSRWTPENVDLSMREFEDGSGDYQRNVGDRADLNLQWNASGDGTYTEFEDGVKVDAGLW